MSEDDTKERMDSALKTARESSAGHLLAIAQRYFPDIKPTGYVKVCPCCKNTENKFRVYRTLGGHWTWGCFRADCRANLSGHDVKHDAVGLIAEMEGLDWKQARDRFLEICGVPNPFKEQQEARDEARKKQKNTHPPAAPPASQKKESASQPTEQSVEPEPAIITPLPATEEPEPDPATERIVSFTLAEGPLPPPPEEVPPSIWEDLYQALTLDTSDRELLKRKRGFTRDTIDKAGYRSSTFANRERLAFLLDKYPHPLLLSLGIASKNPESQEVTINAQLTGLGLIKRGDKVSEDKWGPCNPILIPYRDRLGKVIGIRPHKGGLSGKRFMQEHGFERGFRSTRTRTMPYTNWLFWERPERYEKSCVLTEGEFKGDALAQCGIPAMASPGIQMLKNKIFFEEMVETLRSAGIREVIVCYDNEDKSHRPDPWSRYDTEVWAEYACVALRKAGFNTKLCILPDEWRTDKEGNPDPLGKIDWDGALLQFGKQAEAKFHAILKKAYPYQRQLELFGVNEKRRIIHCRLNRLEHDPKILTGGEEEEELAKLILNTKGEDEDGVEFWRSLNVRELARELRDTRGCYYVPKRLDLKSLKPYFKLQKDIQEQLASMPPEDLEGIAGLEAAKAAVKHIISGRPEILSDFTISCDFQIRTQAGDVEKLFTFRNKHGEVCKDISVPAAACSTAVRFREFCMKTGNFNPMIGDKQIQELMIDIGTFSAWREIRELVMIGRDKESGLWICADCAFADGANPEERSTVYFADSHDIIWYDGIGYRINPLDLAEFAHAGGPKFFQKRRHTPVDVLQEILADPEKERLEVGKIFLQLAADMIATFGDSTGLLVLGTMFGYCYAPELLTDYNGHPGLWIHGRAFSGKTETLRFIMQMWGYDSGYRNITLSTGSTNVGIDRPLAQYSDVPLHLDEFRANESDKARTSTLRMAFNRQAKSKGKMDQTNKTRSVQPHTSPIITGEGVTNDSATLSRYVEAILSAAKRLGTPDQQRARYQRMKAAAGGYHRIVRWIMLHRKRFAEKAMNELDAFLDAEDVTNTVLSDRVRLTYGSAYAAFKTVMDDLGTCVGDAYTNGTIGEFPMAKHTDMVLMTRHNEKLREFTIATARNAASDVANINMVVQFWTDVMTAYGRAPGDSTGIKRFIWFERCVIDPDTNQVTISNAKWDIDGVVRCVIVKPPELYAEYEIDTRSRNREPELSLTNIRGECQNERFWVPSPKNHKRRAHRMSFDKIGQISVWVLRWDRMEPALQNVFAEQFEKEENENEPELSVAATEKSPF